MNAQLFPDSDESDLPTSPVREPTTRELSRFVRYYKEHVREHTPTECRGVVRNIQNMLKKGITLAQIQVALQNYSQDPYVQDQDPRCRKHIRSFFSREIILQWQTPMPKRGASAKPGVASQFAALDRLDQLALNRDK